MSTKISTCLLVFLLFLSSPIFAKPLHFVWNTYCPYTCVISKNGEKGYAMEVVEAIFVGSKYEVKFTYVLSWNRAMSQVQSGERDAIVFSFHRPQSDSKFIIPSEPLAIERNTSFVVRKKTHWVLNDISSLGKLKHIGVYKGTVWDDKQVADFELAHQHKFIYLHGDDIVSRAFNMLRRGRLDAWEDSETLLNYHLYKAKVNDLRIELLAKPRSSLGDVLFSVVNPKSPEYAAFFSAGIKKLRNSGKLADILKKYGLKDWQ